MRAIAAAEGELEVLGGRPEVGVATSTEIGSVEKVAEEALAEGARLATRALW